MNLEICRIYKRDWILDALCLIWFIMTHVAFTFSKSAMPDGKCRIYVQSFQVTHLLPLTWKSFCDNIFYNETDNQIFDAGKNDKIL